MRTFVILVSLAVLLVPSIASANMLVNPGFESDGEQGHVTGWSNEGPVGWGGTNIGGSTERKNSGSWSAKNAWDGCRWQDVSVTGGEGYQLSGWVYIPSGTAGTTWGSFIGVKWYNASGDFVGSWEKGDFSSYTRDQFNQGTSGILTAPLDAVTAKVNFGTWCGDPSVGPIHPTYFDDFDFSPIPEPASLVLLGTGLVGLVGLTKKRKA